MRRQLVLVVIVLMNSFPYATHAQENPETRAIPANDVSPYLGSLIAHPEALSGLWETSNRRGGAVGIHLLLITTIPGDAKTLNEVRQSWYSLGVGVYERKSPTIQLGEENNFSDSPQGGNVSYENRRLKLHFDPHVATDPSIDLDLFHEANGSWTGRFHRGAFDSTVTLRRPAAGNGRPNEIVGTWVEETGSISSCVHIAEQSATEYTGWSDALQAWGAMRFANNIPRPAKAFERYGELMKVNVDGTRKISLELYAYTAICCSHTFVGTLTADGRFIQGIWPQGANQAPHSTKWRKMLGDSCVSPEP